MKISQTYFLITIIYCSPFASITLMVQIRFYTIFVTVIQSPHLNLKAWKIRYSVMLLETVTSEYNSFIFRLSWKTWYTTPGNHFERALQRIMCWKPITTIRERFQIQIASAFSFHQYIFFHRYRYDTMWCKVMIHGCITHIINVTVYFRDCSCIGNSRNLPLGESMCILDHRCINVLLTYYYSVLLYTCFHPYQF